MRWFFVSALWVSALATLAPQGQALGRKNPHKAKSRPHRGATRKNPPAPAAAKALVAEQEPAPAGEVAVLWAQPRALRPGVKIRIAPNFSGTTLGELRGDSAIAIKVPELLKKPRAQSGCHAWLEALPTGYLCDAEVKLRPGYLSDPPTQEKPTAWQRLRYGVVKVASAKIEGALGQQADEAGYLRGILHRGDGVTVVREKEDRVQIYGQKWLRKMDVSLITPPALAPIDLQTLPAAQRFLVAWAVPPQGETQVAIYTAAGAGGEKSSQPLWIPRYSRLWWTAGNSNPGRSLVYLTDETRTGLGTRPDTQAVAQAAAFEIDPSQLRRVTRAPIPAGLQEGERWIDISLSEQVAVAYAGDTPLFAALISTGKGAGSTPAGSFSIYRKYLTQTMANQAGAASQYDFREVPYAQFFNGRIGFHAVLWHDFLGHPVSHGCVNLSPAAAEQFFSFAKPELPSGWHTVNAVTGANIRGTRVVVRR